MPAPIFYGVNRLETSTITAGSTVTDHPLLRLSDRFTGPQWQGTGPIVWDQGASPLTFDAVLLASGHNLAGATLTIQTDDNAGFASPTILGSLVPASTASVLIPCTGTVERYSRLVIAGGPATVTLAELFASVACATPGTPLLRTSPNQFGTFTGEESETGVWMSYVKALPRWEASWQIVAFTRTVRDLVFAFFQSIAGGARPFFVRDDEGVLRFARWMNPETAFEGLIPQQYTLTIDVREVAA